MIRDLLGIEKTYSTKNMYIVNFVRKVDDIDEIHRYIVKGPFVRAELDWYQIFPDMSISFISHSGEYISDLIETSVHFNDLFPDLKRVTISQVSSILESLHHGDELENMKRRVEQKSLTLQK